MTMSWKFLKAYLRWSPALARNFHPPPSKLKKKMPPKKAAAPEKKILLGRPSNNLKIGIVGTWQSFPCLLQSHPITGLPNVGKSSFFNVLSNTGPFPLPTFHIH
jgi:hypothetical protein